MALAIDVGDVCARSGFDGATCGGLTGKYWSKSPRNLNQKYGNKNCRDYIVRPYPNVTDHETA